MSRKTVRNTISEGIIIFQRKKNFVKNSKNYIFTIF